MTEGLAICQYKRRLTRPKLVKARPPTPALRPEKLEKVLGIDIAVAPDILNSFKQSDCRELLDPRRPIDVKLFNRLANSGKGREITRLVEGEKVLRKFAGGDIQDIVAIRLHVLGPRLREAR